MCFHWQPKASAQRSVSGPLIWISIAPRVFRQPRRRSGERLDSRPLTPLSVDLAKEIENSCLIAGGRKIFSFYPAPTDFWVVSQFEVTDRPERLSWREGNEN